MKFIPSALLLLFAATFFCVWLLERRRRHLLFFSLAFAAVGSATIVQFALWPPDIGYNTIVSAMLYAAGPLLLVEGALARSSRSMPAALHAAWFAAIVGLLCYFYFVDNNLQVRVYALNIVMGSIILSGAWKLKDLMRGNVIDRAMVWLLLGLGLTFFARVLLDGNSVPTDDVDAFFESKFWIWAQFSMSLIGAALGLGLLVVACADIVLALKSERDTDPLTGLLNRRGLQGREARLLSARRGKPLGVVACDIDRFKDINDRFGHAAGDLVLATFAGIMRKRLRAGDVAARTGGEEFIMALNCSLDQAYSLTEKLRREIASAHFSGLPQDFAVTCSFGIAKAHPGEGLWDVIGRADKILYAAKRAGRNRTFAEGLQLPSAA